MICLINPRDEYLEKTGGNLGDRCPLALAQLSAYLKLQGYETKIFDLNHDTKDSLNEFISSYDPEFICFSVSTPNYFQVLELAKKLKHGKNVLIAGGNHITDNPNEERTLKVFDYLITGDGEEALSKVIKERPQQQLIYGGKNLDPSSLPIPDYEGIKFERYFMTVEGKKGAVVITSRGCYANCCYCGSAKIKKWRPRSPEHVMGELRLLYNKYGVRGFYFADDVITSPRKSDQERFIRLCGLIKAEFPDVVFRATTRADTLSEDLCKAMAEAGCKWISLGIESGSDTVLKAMNKYMSVAQQENGINLCLKYGIGIKGFFICGLPGETDLTMRETIDWAKGLKQKWGSKFITDIYKLVPSPSTPIWENPEKFGMEVFKSDHWEAYNQILESEQPLFKHPNLTEDRIKYWIEQFKKEIGGNKTTK